jgi:eukaryotic-like serine/threonine-protein kinase
MRIRAVIITIIIIALALSSYIPSNAASDEYVFDFKFGNYGSGDGEFNYPSGVAYDPNNNRIIVADSGNYRIQVFDSNGKFLFKFGSNGNGDGEFNYPSGVAYDPNNNRIIVADSGNNDRIQVFDSNGKFLFKFGSEGSGDGEFDNPHGVAYDPNNNRIIVADSGNHRIQVFDSNGKFLFKFGNYGSGDGEFNYPHGVAYDPNNNRIIVANSGNYRIQVFDSNGKFLFKFGKYGSREGEFDSPTDVAYDHDNNRIIVADTSNDRIQVFDSNGKFLFKFGNYGSGDGQFDNPHGVAYDPNNNRIIVADTNNNRVQVFSHSKSSIQQPIPFISSDKSMVFINEGETFKIKFTASNLGITPNDKGLSHVTISVSDGIEIVDWTKWSDKDKKFNKGDIISHQNVNKIQAQNEMLEVYSSFPQGTTRELIVTFKSKSFGNQWINYRFTLVHFTQDEDLSTAQFYRDPSLSSFTDQQGWPVKSIYTEVGQLKPDLTITFFQVIGYDNISDTLAVNWAETNKGDGKAGPYTVGIYLSTKEYGADFLLQRFQRNGLDANRSIEYIENIRFGNNIPPGSYYLTIFIDDTLTVFEKDENNNIGSTTPNTFHITAPKPPPSLTLFDPQIDGLKVTVNGITKPGYNNASIHRIQFNWGDGNIEYSWFPATHTYEKEGEYAITVTTYQSDGLTTTSTTTVTLKQELTTGTIQQPQPPSPPTSQPQPSSSSTSQQPPSSTLTVTTQPPTIITDTGIPIEMLIIGIIAATVSIPIVIFARRSKTVPNFPYELTNKYEPIEHIGEGGFADVFKVKRKHDGKIIALKVPKDKRLKEFADEVAAWLRLEHKNIVKLFVAGTDPIPHLEIELVDGITINNKIVRDLRGLIEIKNGNIDEGKAVSIVRGIAEGLRYAHNNNKVYHLDLKPENILITSDYTPKITDFGLAKVKAISLSTKGLTPLYAAPEQLDNSKYGSSDNRTDIYQLGLIFYELLTGRLPYDANTNDEIKSIILDERQFEYVSKHKIELAKYDHIVSKMLAKRKEDRYQSIDGFLSDLNILEKRSIEIEELRKSIEKSKDSIRKNKDPERIKEYKIKIIEDAIKLVNNCIELKDLVELRKELYEIPKYIVVKEELKQKLDNAIKQVDYCIDNRIELSDDFKDKINILLHEIKMSLLT